MRNHGHQLQPTSAKKAKRERGREGREREGGRGDRWCWVGHSGTWFVSMGSRSGWSETRAEEMQRGHSWAAAPHLRWNVAVLPPGPVCVQLLMSSQGNPSGCHRWLQPNTCGCVRFLCLTLSPLCRDVPVRPDLHRLGLPVHRQHPGERAEVQPDEQHPANHIRPAEILHLRWVQAGPTPMTEVECVRRPEEPNREEESESLTAFPRKLHHRLYDLLFCVATETRPKNVRYSAIHVSVAGRTRYPRMTFLHLCSPSDGRGTAGLRNKWLNHSRVGVSVWGRNDGTIKFIHEAAFRTVTENRTLKEQRQ